jgi:hypothetical protein
MDKSQTWFLVQESTLPIQDGVLAVWDTSTISDGEYDLRLVIHLIEGDQVDVRITDLRVHNDTPIESETRLPILAPLTVPSDLPTLTATLEPTTALVLTSLPPTTTLLPVNPAQVSTAQAMLTFGKGTAITVGIFAILGAYLGLRAALHSRI